MPFGSLWDGAVALYLGQLALLLDRSAEARRHLESAALLHSRVGARAHLAETWLARARLRAREGEEEAARDAREAAALYRDLGMAEGEAEAESLSRTRVRAVPEPDATHRLVRRGKSWYVRFAGNETRLPDSLGLAYLAALISRRDEVVHVLELTGRRRGGDADSGPMLDARARTAVRARLQALREDVEEARARNDLGSAEVAGSELERLEAELIGALGLGGRSRRVGDPVERARKAVYNRIRAATRSIEGELPDLGRHLRRSVRTGRTCMYAPDAPVRWIVEV
jgi:hypothetical protein